MDSERAQALGFGLKLGSGFTNLALSLSGLDQLGLEAVGLLKVAIRPCAVAKIFLYLCNRAYSGFQKSPRTLEQIRPGLHQAFGLCSAALVLSPGPF